MKAAELYRILEKELGPPLTARGLRKVRRSRLTFQQLLEGKYHTVWFQTDHYGWDAHAGGKFFVNFTVSMSPDPEDPERREARLNFFLSDIELQRARKYQNEIVARIPMRRFGTVEEIAAQIAWLCSEDCSFATGAVFDLSGGRATY